MADATSQGPANLSETQISLSIDRYFSRAEVQLQHIKNLVNKLETDNNEQLVDAYFKIRNFLFNLSSMQDLLKNATTQPGTSPEFHAVSKRRFVALETQISGIWQSFETLASSAHDMSGLIKKKAYAEDISRVHSEPLNTALHNPSDLLSPQAGKIKVESAEIDTRPYKELTEAEEIATWIEGLRQRKPTKKQDNSKERKGDKKDSDDELTRQQHLQDELAGSLVSMVEVLKSNSIAFGDALSKDEKVLDEAQVALNSNLDRLAAEGRRLGLLSSSTSKATLLYYLFVISTITIFVMTAIFIRLNEKIK